MSDECEATSIASAVLCNRCHVKFLLIGTSCGFLLVGKQEFGKKSEMVAYIAQMQ